MASSAMKHLRVFPLYLSKIPHPLLYIVILFSFWFLLGYHLFMYTSVRVGPHPSVLKDEGAYKALHVLLDRCISKDRSIDSIPCMRKEMPFLLQKWSVRSLLLALDRHQATSERLELVRARCHDIAHLIGETDVKVKKDIGRTLQSCSATCASGCFHGAIQGWVSQGHSIVSPLSMCDVSAQNISACFHGVGHGLADMFGSDIKKALTYCDEGTQEGRASCANGILMELYQPGLLTPSRLSLPPNHPDWCSGLAPPYDHVCYSHAGVYAYKQGEDNLEYGIAMCQKVPTKHQGDCFGEMAKKLYFVWPLSEDMIKNAEMFCQKEASVYFEECIDNFMKPPA
jgi:hypothetical protein